jgi:hypothetical protein
MRSAPGSIWAKFPFYRPERPDCNQPALQHQIDPLPRLINSEAIPKLALILPVKLAASAHGNEATLHNSPEW